MSRVVRFGGPRMASVVDLDDPVASPGEVLIETAFSGISAGTELTAYRGSNPYLAHTWDGDRRLFVDGVATHAYPLDGWGYEEVGRVIAAGSSGDDDLVGRWVWGAWGHRSRAVRVADYVRARVLSERDDLKTGVFAKIGAIALNAVLDADIHVGETVVVFGAGVPGQITAQLARLNGGRVVVADLVAARRDLALELGADAVIDPATDDVAEAVRAMTDDRGADVVIEMSGSYHALHEATRTVSYSSRVVASGFFQDGGQPLRLGEEFHHNRVAIIGSQISGVAPGLRHRWDELRMSKTVLALAADQRLALEPLITHVVPDSSAPAAFQMLDADPQDALQVVLDYGIAS